jgi:hypothetical protein
MMHVHPPPEGVVAVAVRVHPPPLDSVERVARLRALAALALVFAGPAAAELVRLLRAAEGDAAMLQDADRALARLPAIPLRRALSVLPRVL